MKKDCLLLVLIALFNLTGCEQPKAPEAYGPVPTEAQLKWQELERYAFIHFSMNTFTDMEWGYGDKDPQLFNPSELDCRQWCRLFKEAGMKGVILTAKHHDGFCLWPSAYTDYSVKQSPWRNGNGDLVRELADACKEYGLKLGIYLSPWDRNHKEYGTEAYITYFRNQLNELLTNYGDIFEVWFDGANGGSGYYGGADETRSVDRKTYYDWPGTNQLVKKLQPDADSIDKQALLEEKLGHPLPISYEDWLKDCHYEKLDKKTTRWLYQQERGFVEGMRDVSLKEIARQRIDEFTTTLRKYIL